MIIILNLNIATNYQVSFFLQKEPRIEMFGLRSEEVERPCDSTLYLVLGVHESTPKKLSINSHIS